MVLGYTFSKRKSIFYLIYKIFFYFTGQLIYFMLNYPKRKDNPMEEINNQPSYTQTPTEENERQLKIEELIL